MLEVVIDSHAIRIGERFSVSFQRTLRIPDDGRTYPLPPGLGVLPVFRVADYADRLPSHWSAEAAFLPLYQREALWLAFAAAPWKPNATQIAIGRINAVSGEVEDTGAGLRDDPQNYLVCPDQPWLDGINTGDGTIRQFVAMALGEGYTVEAALTGHEEFGGIQITVFEPKPGLFPEQAPPTPPGHGSFGAAMGAPMAMAASAQVMGLGAGGVMKQKIYPDPHGLEAWDGDTLGRVEVHLVNSAQFHEITGAQPPPTPVDAATYTQYGLPWFDLYDEAARDVAPPERLTGARTIAERDAERGESESISAVEVRPEQIKKLRRDESGH